jgi:predicted glycoside hydrolase/deacetylase ChbG (UPF0249 family)
LRLIVNADDFGLSKGVSLGILDCMKKGIVTSTTAMVNGWYFEEALKEARIRGIENIGIHLTLTWGKPTLPAEEVSSLINENGTFYKIGQTTAYNYEEIKNELKAQIDKFFSQGIKPTHLDGHHHFYGFDKKVLDIVLDLAEEYKLPVRCLDKESSVYYKQRGIRTTELCSTEFYQYNVKEEFFVELLKKYETLDSLEIMTHPAYVDEDLIKATTYNTKRQHEFEVLTSEAVKKYIFENDISMISYKEL